MEGNYCSHCGQSAKVSRVDLPSFLHEVSNSIFQVNSGFFFTLKEMFLNPGSALKDYLDGKRKRHFKPIAYALTLSTLYFVVVKITDQNTWLDDFFSGWLEGVNERNEVSNTPELLLWIAKNYAYATLILLPIYALASYLSFLKFRKNYLEHLVINAYITGHQAIFYAFFALLGVVFKTDLLIIPAFLAALIYTYLVFWHFFSEENRLVNVLRSTMTYILYLIFALLLMGSFMAIIKLAAK